jgi:hydroxyacylglutathione hydrolase
MLKIHLFGCLKDNFGLLVHDADSGETVTIDTPDGAAILAEARQLGWQITQIWNTHWHADHAGGNAAIVEATGATVSGPAEVERIGLKPDRIVTEGDEVRIGEHIARVLDVGGHTHQHVAYVFDQEGIAFVGDTLFSLGCGRVIEGNPAQMWASLSKLAALPPDTQLYCAHEYTANNGKFAITVDPNNSDLKARIEEVARLRTQGLPTVPSSLALELATNPFLRAPLLKQAIGRPDSEDWEAFAEIRRRKDNFRPV